MRQKVVNLLRVYDDEPWNGQDRLPRPCQRMARIRIAAQVVPGVPLQTATLARHEGLERLGWVWEVTGSERIK